MLPLASTLRGDSTEECKQLFPPVFFLLLLRNQVVVDGADKAGNLQATLLTNGF